MVHMTVVVVGILVLHYLGALTGLERLLLAGLRPVGRTLTFWLTQPPSDAGSIDEKERQQPDLEQRLADLSVENIELRSALEALGEIAVQQKFLEERRLSGVTGRIFARSADPTSEYVMIDAGLNDGLEVGAPAIVGRAMIIGRVVSVSPDTARVLLTTDNRSSFAGVVADNPAAEGVVSGNRGLSLRMELIPQSEIIQPHQIVVSSGTDARVPRGLILGEIERVEKQQGALFQSATLRTLYQTSRLDAVTILRIQLQ